MQISKVPIGFAAIFSITCTLWCVSNELIRCRVCFGRVSVNAVACIHCGEPGFKGALKVIEKDALQDRQGVFYEVNGKEPFTGAVVDGRYADGHPKIQQEYRDGKKWGVRKKWYENGQLMQDSQYADGVAHGLMQEWHENGERMAEGSFKEGKLDGFVRRWYDDGKREAEYPYKDGELNGIVLQWNRKGVMIGKKSYEKGKLMARLAVDPPEAEDPDGKKVLPPEVLPAPAPKPEPQPPAKALPVRPNVFEGLQLGSPN